MKRIAFMAAALMIVPVAARAQEHNEHMQHHTASHATEMKQHEQFLQSVIDKRADLQLTDAQVAKLEAFKTRMAEHHKMMMQHGAMMQHDSSKAAMQHDAGAMGGTMMHGDSAMTAMHNEVMAIFTPAQRKQVEALMKEYMKACKGEGMQCRMDQ